MRTKILIILTLFFVCACNTEKDQNSDNAKQAINSEEGFDQTKWSIKEGKDYPFREEMLNAIVYNDSIRDLNKDEILKLLGEPSYYRDNENFLYYRISETRLVSWTLHTKTMVIKISEDNSIDWIKIHE